ncbi:MAG: hypothetical protein HY875_09170 [Chloroflexi bacterium]|nr:hypothetical protein [Chloroflexota bacterium]
MFKWLWPVGELPEFGKYLRLPLFVFGLTWIVFLVALWRWNLDSATAASWAGVATAFSFLGAGFITFAEVVRALRPAAPKLELSYKGADFHRVIVTISNRGTAAAYHVDGTTEVRDTAGMDRFTPSFGNFVTLREAHRSLSDGGIEVGNYVWHLPDPLPPDSNLDLCTLGQWDEPTMLLTIVASCANGSPAAPIRHRPKNYR